jgi:hypothetical protein
MRRHRVHGSPLLQIPRESPSIPHDTNTGFYSGDNSSCDYLPTTQVSTPSTSWSIDEEPFTYAPPPVSVTSAVPQPPVTLGASSPFGWNWPATALSSTPVASLEPVSTYPNPHHPALSSPYGSYAVMQNVYSHASSDSRSPQLYSRNPHMIPEAAPYHVPNTMATSMDYQYHDGSPYHMQ